MFSRIAKQRMVSRVAASGMYGFTKAIQNDVTLATKKLERYMTDISRSLELKHPEAGTFFKYRAKASDCPFSQALVRGCVMFDKPTKMYDGVLGFKPNLVKACLKSIHDLTLKSGEIACNLYSKNRDHIPFLETHLKEVNCPYTRMILQSYPIDLAKEIAGDYK